MLQLSVLRAPQAFTAARASVTMFKTSSGDGLRDEYGCDDPEGVPPLPSGVRLAIGQVRQPGDACRTAEDEETWERIGVSAEDAVPSGAQIWPAAAVLCRWQCSRAEEFCGASVLELGAGTGVCGLFAAGLGASRVVLTDGGDRALPIFSHDGSADDGSVPISSDAGLPAERATLTRLMEANVRRNCHLFALDASVSADVYSWGSVPLPDGSFDWVIASDVTYEIEAHAALAATLAELLQGERPPRVVLAHGHRCPPAARRFGASLARWDDGDLELAAFAAAANRCGLRMVQLCAERPRCEVTDDGVRRWTSDVSVIEVLRAQDAA